MIRCISFLALIATAMAQSFGTCGKPTMSQPDISFTAGSRIVGGQEAAEGAWPFIVALLLDNGEEYYPSQFCGGSIIRRQWIATAGHCLADMENDEIVRRVRVVIGVNNLEDAMRNTSKVLRVVKVVKHPSYDKRTTNNDVALLKLEKQLNFDSKVQPICLPTHDAHDTRLAANVDYSTGRKACFVAGWGLLREQEQLGSRAPGTTIGGGSNRLSQVAVDMFTDRECTQYLAKVGITYTDKMICLGFPQGGADSCQGDSGGPLVCKDKDGHWELSGIVSYGVGCARANLPGVYTNVYNLKSFIDSNTLN
ncbi:chymotrypsin B-like [Paramacrobiotus metropolitanus]|uniref:chymotrypsin B-like n=1 Tax=Paramacrobiotus metropolitanus TaxID=2943436 RepID=UPI0024463BC9|nr:chymotrypsin B-like [Paramacrobiotus metropolitanus]